MTTVRQENEVRIQPVGLAGIIIRFADRLTEADNRAALAFRAAVLARSWAGVVETSTSLASVFVRFDPTIVTYDALCDAMGFLLEERDWRLSPLPAGRRLWQVPTVFGTDLAPQPEEAADLAGLSEDAAIQSLSSARVRVLTIGFGPGQPYLGPLPDIWNIPRQDQLTPMVPRGALVLAVSQFVLFSAASPTGWRHVGQTGFNLFRPHSEHPFALRIGDELQFFPVSKPELQSLCDRDPDFGGASAREISQ